MRKAIRRSRAAAATEALELLAALAGKGAYALPPGSREPGRDTCAVFSLRTGPEEPVAHATRAAVSHALQNGWLEPDKTGTRIVLVQAGQRVLRAARRKAALQAKRSGPRVRVAAVEEVEGPLAWLRKRKDRLGKPFMSEAQISAAERLASDFWRGGMSPRVTANCPPQPRRPARVALLPGSVLK